MSATKTTCTTCKKQHLGACRYAAKPAAKTTCPTCKKQHLGACRYAAEPTAKPFSFNPDAFVFAPQQLAAEAEAVDAELLSNDALAALNPEFAAALAAGEELDEKALYANAVLADAYANAEADVKELDDELTMLDIEFEEDN